MPAMRDASLQFLQTLVNTPSPSGHEVRGQRVWLNYVQAFAEETYTDAYGNAVAVLNKGGSPRLMLAAHADEIGLAVNYIDKQGFIYVRRLGGVDAAITKAQRVTIHSRQGPVNGVVGNVAPHLTKNDGERKLPKIEDLFIDIGADSRKAAEKLVQIGDPITLNDQFELLRNDLAVARAFDNRIGTFAVAETLRLLAESRGKLKAEVSAVSNIMEEVGLLGARQIAYALKPDAALVVDVTHATDYPDIDKRVNGNIKLGAGPVISVGANINPRLGDLLIKTAKAKRIPHQLEAAPGGTGTDANAMQISRAGVATALVSIPNRYMHTQVEVVSYQDLEAAARLIAETVAAITPEMSFVP